MSEQPDQHAGGMSEQETVAMKQWLEDSSAWKGKPNAAPDMASRITALERGDQLRAGKDITVEGNQISFKGRSGQAGADGTDGGTLNAPVQPAVVFNNGILVTENFYVRSATP